MQSQAIAAHAAPLPKLAAQWRIEIQKRGRFWQWRKGSHAQRVAKYGGKFEILADERKEDYERNKERIEQRRNKTQQNAWERDESENTRDAQADSIPDAPRRVTTLGKRGELLPTGGARSVCDEHA